MNGEQMTKSAFDDFDAWHKAKHPERDDYLALAHEYCIDCDNGDWVVTAHNEDGE